MPKMYCLSIANYSHSWIKKKEILSVCVLCMREREGEREREREKVRYVRKTIKKTKVVVSDS